MRRFHAPSIVRNRQVGASGSSEMGTSQTDGQAAGASAPGAGSAHGKATFTCPRPLAAGKAAFSRPKPLEGKENGMTDAPDQQEAKYYAVLFTKRAPNKKRKNKQFADGVLVVKPDANCTLYSAEGKVAAKARAKGCWDLADGAEVALGNWELEIDRSLDEAAFRSGKCFQSTAAVLSEAAPVAAAAPTRAFRPLQPNAAERGAPQPPARPRWLHDPAAEGALVLGPTADGSVPVVVDPYIGRHLRPHQREGVAFLYGCVMGLRSPSQFGAVLADEMGLGHAPTPSRHEKTLQVIALMWTLLKQGPQGSPAARKCIVVTPTSLTGNWAAEVNKWLGVERLRALVLQPAEAAQQVLDFKHGAVFRCVVASYELLRKHAPGLAGAADLLVCDEGHRLKAAGGSKTLAALLALGCRRRVLLTGTPLQNNLEEFHALVSFVCPDALGTLASFRAVFAGPIGRGQERGASAAEAALGAERSAELAARTGAFMLRCTSAAVARFLPPLRSYVLFCPPSPAQLELYAAVLRSSLVNSLLHGGGGACPDPLPAITLLRKLCNHPGLLPPEWTERAEGDGAEEAAAEGTPEPDVAASGKLAALALLMGRVLGGSDDRLVVACGSVRMLDRVQALCAQRAWGTARIDGSTPPAQRQPLVDAFNRHGSARVCLLSTRAGGAGLNLTGANHLALLDSDWNPAVDLQAMARVWRDGQTKPCAVYRLLTTGTIEEKIYQRQLAKGELASVMGAAGGKAQGGGFSREELRELFRLERETRCSTAALLGPAAFPEAGAGDLTEPLQQLVQAGAVSFVHLLPKPPGMPAEEAGDAPEAAD